MLECKSIPFKSKYYHYVLDNKMQCPIIFISSNPPTDKKLERFLIICNNCKFFIIHSNLITKYQLYFKGIGMVERALFINKKYLNFLKFLFKNKFIKKIVYLI